MGADITWDHQKQTIDIQKDNKEIHLQIGSDLVYVTNVKYGTIRYTPEVAPQISDSRTVIPLRFISGNLGCTASWDGETQTITSTE